MGRNIKTFEHNLVVFFFKKKLFFTEREKARKYTSIPSSLLFLKTTHSFVLRKKMLENIRIIAWQLSFLVYRLIQPMLRPPIALWLNFAKLAMSVRPHSLFF